MENAEKFSDSKGIFKPKVWRLLWSRNGTKNYLDSCRNLISMYKKHLVAVMAKEDFAIDY